jgi:tetratricopeptide (TPR) repeat protein
VEERTDLKAVLRLAGDFGMLARLVSAGFPVILEKGAEQGESGEWMGHYVIAAGYHQGAQETLILYSSMASEPVSAVKSPALEEDWQPFNYLYLVVYPAEKEAELLRILGDQSGAEENYRQALEKASQDMHSGADLDDYQGAAEAYDQAAEIYAQLPPQQRPARMLWYQSRPYWAYYYTGRYDDVIRLADETLGADVDPVLEESFYWRALAKEAKGDITGAIADLEESLKLNPNFSAGLYQLSRLQGGS